MVKGAPNIEVMEFWEVFECNGNYFISPGIGI
jgi:hypothetical protein